MIVGVLLAAGAGTRMGGPKALARANGQSFLVRGVRTLWAVCDTVYVVVGADAERVCQEAGDEFERLVEAGMLAPERAARRRRAELEVRFVTNPRWKQGMLSSVRAGLLAALAGKPRGVLLLPVDHPEVQPASIQALGAMLEEAIGASKGKAASAFAYALVPRFRGHRGHPVAISAALAGAVARDAAARDLADGLRRNARLIGYLDVADPGILVNRNTPASGRATAKQPARAKVKRAPKRATKRAAKRR